MGQLRNACEALILPLISAEEALVNVCIVSAMGLLIQREGNHCLPQDGWFAYGIDRPDLHEVVHSTLPNTNR
jgi:hypothetical protein